MRVVQRWFMVPVFAFTLLGGATLAIAQQAAEAAEPPISARGGEAELEMLTEQVIQNLQQLTGKPLQESGGKAEEDLFRTLNALVEKALAEGKTSQDVLQLIEEALERKGEASLEELIAATGGKVDLRQLLDRLVARAAARNATPADDYTRQLMQEGDRTTLDAAAVMPHRAATPASPAPAMAAAATGAGERQKPLGGGRTVIVQPGETLGTLARRYYGDAALWRRIYEANRDRIKDPDLLLAGQKIVIP